MTGSGRVSLGAFDHDDLEAISRSVVRLRAEVPEDASTAGILGSERVGNGIVIDSDGLILTIGYLITEATDVWLTTADGHQFAGHALAYDQATGFGLVLPLEKPDIPPLRFGKSSDITEGGSAYVLSYKEFCKPHPVRVLARREFAGAWEYLLDGAIFTTPAHPHWSGSALVDHRGELVGLGSLLVREVVAGEETNANMFVPIDLLKPILHNLTTRGRSMLEARPWLGIYSVEVSGKVYVTGVVEGGPAQTADVREGDVITQVAERDIATLPAFYRAVWAMGPAGTKIPLTTMRDGGRLHFNVDSVDRTLLLKRPQAH